jgi:abortive infection bacteriophage resistance protein
MSTQQLDQHVMPPFTIDQQIDFLASQGLVIRDRYAVAEALAHVNCHRLCRYASRENNQFPAETTFELIWQAYQFDKKLRYLILELTEDIEISLRAHLAHHLSLEWGGTFNYLDGSLFLNPKYHQEFLAELDDQVSKRRRDDPVIKRCLAIHDNKLPIWVALETFSFGMLSRFFSNLRSEIKDAISIRHYQHFPSTYTAVWLWSLGNARNICAHYGRLYRKSFAIHPALGNIDAKLGIRRDSLFAIIFVTKYLVEDRSVWDRFVINIEALLDGYSEFIDMSLIGFPEKWVIMLKEPDSKRLLASLKKE